MRNDTPPQVECRRLPTLNLDDWSQVRALLKDADSVELQQDWLEGPSPHFQPATVRTGWTDEALIVYAQLTDLDIFNDIRGLNEWAFNKGDAFEIFLRPCQQPAYFEFHITPFSQLLQLRFPSAEEFKAKTHVPGWDDECFVHDPVLETRAVITQEKNLWEVVAAIPFSFVAEEGDVRDGSQWLFSFSRYDHTRSLPEPTLSSTSSHKVCNFHRQEEWGALTFVL